MLRYDEANDIFYYFIITPPNIESIKLESDCCNLNVNQLIFSFIFHNILSLLFIILIEFRTLGAFNLNQYRTAMTQREILHFDCWLTCIFFPEYFNHDKNSQKSTFIIINKRFVQFYWDSFNCIIIKLNWIKFVFGK